jgi:hypothetical protein
MRFRGVPPSNWGEGGERGVGKGVVIVVCECASYPPEATENNYSYRKIFIERSITAFTPKRRKSVDH